MGVCGLLNLWLVPLSHTAFRQWQFEIRTPLGGVLLQEGVFSQIGNDLTVYARYRDPDGTLRGILVHDQRDAGAPVTILAEAGRITLAPTGPRVTLLNGVRQQVDRAPANAVPGTAPLRLNTLSFSENSVDLARAARGEEARSRDSRERSIGELLNPDPAEGLREREIRRFRAEAHQRLSGPLTTLSFALVGLAVALNGEFRRHGGGMRIAVGIALVVGLLAFGLTAGNLAQRDNAWVPLIRVQALLPALVAAWWIAFGQGGLRRPGAPAAAAP
jgi:lipopolysaccharide export system permease protein